MILAISLAVLPGCHVGCCSKRASEKKCPTDIRKTHCWCFGEDALFRYPCGPNRVYYGHKATCWREWPTSGSAWRDVHCGPPAMAAGELPYDAQGAPLPPGMPSAATPGIEIPNAFRSDAGQAPAPLNTVNPLLGEAGQMPPSPPAPPMPETGSPIFIKSEAAEPNDPPATPDDGGVQPPVPNGPDAAQPMPEQPISSRPFPPMASVEAAPESHSWTASVEPGREFAQSREVAVVAAGGAALPFVGELSPRQVEPAATLVTDQETTATAGKPQWRSIAHDGAARAAGNCQDDATGFRPPNVEDTQSAEAPRRAPDDSQQSLGEKTGSALRRFMADDDWSGAGQ